MHISQIVINTVTYMSIVWPAFRMLAGQSGIASQQRHPRRAHCVRFASRSDRMIMPMLLSSEHLALKCHTNQDHEIQWSTKLKMQLLMECT